MSDNYTYREWKDWLNSLPIDLRWFVYLVILRPLIDVFYDLKNISPFISPLYIAGILTPVLCLAGIIRYKKTGNSNIDFFFGAWSVLLIFSSLLFLFKRFNIGAFELFLKLTLPIYLFYFLRRFIINLSDLTGILYAFLISAYIASLFIIYEVVFHPIQEVEYTRGVERLRGGFADVMNYGIYINMGFLISAYFHLRNTKIKFFGISNIFLFFPVSILILTKINHVSSYIIFAFILAFFLLYYLKGNIMFGSIVILIITLLALNIGNRIFEDRISPLIEKDISALQGEKDQSKLLHGRMGRWERKWSTYSEMDIVAKLFSTNIDAPLANLISAGIHNDYLRILFTTGIIGFIFYLITLLLLFFKSLLVLAPEKYLIMSSISVLMLYSVSTTPTFYPIFMYAFLSIVAYFCLPLDLMYETKETEDTVIG